MKVAVVDILVLFLIFKENLSVFTIEYDIRCRLFIYDLYYVEVCALYTHFVQVKFEFLRNRK